MKLYGVKKFAREYIGSYINIPKLAWLVLPLILLDTFIISICLNISQYLIKVFNLKELVIGEIISFYYAGSLIGALIGGSLTLKYSTAYISSFGFLILAAMFYFISTYTNADTLAGAMFVIGLVGTIVSTSNVASLIKSANENKNYRSRLISLELVLFNLSFSLGAFVLIELDSASIIEALKFMIIGFLVSSVYLFGIKDKEIFMPPQRNDKKSLYAPKNIPRFFLALSTVLVVGLIFSMVKVIYTPTIVSRFGNTNISVFVASINPWVILLVQPYLVSKIRNKHNAILMGIGGCIIGMGYFFFGVSTSLVTTSVVLIVLTFGEILYSPISKDIAVSCFNKGEDGFPLGVWRAVFLGSGFVGPTMSGWIAERFGNIYVWELCGIFGIICLLIAFILNKDSGDLVGNSSLA